MTDVVELPVTLDGRGRILRWTFTFEPGQLVIAGRRGDQVWIIPRADVEQVDWYSRTQAIFRSPPGSPERFTVAYLSLGAGVDPDLWLWLRGSPVAPRWVRRRLLWLRLVAGTNVHYALPGLEWRALPRDALQLGVRGDRIRTKRVLEAWGCEFPDLV